MSEKLKLFQNIDQEREAVVKQLKETDKARHDLKVKLEETVSKTKNESDKLQQYWDFLLKENKTINHNMLEMRNDLKISQK